MGKSFKITIMLMLISLFCISAKAPSNPAGIGGKVTIDDMPAQVDVKITNVNQQIEKITIANHNGFYGLGIDADDGDKIKIEIEFSGTTYSNFIYADLSKQTQWLNISITTDNGNGGNGGNGGGGGTPPNGGNGEETHIPQSDFDYLPDVPKENETVTFTSTSTDEDNDIIVYEWTIQDKKIYGEQITHTFKTKGVYEVLLKVIDNEGNQDVESRTVTVIQKNIPRPDENLTVFIKTEEKNTKVDIYKDNSYLTTVHTNDSKLAKVILLPGDYNFKTSEGTKHFVITQDNGTIFLQYSKIDIIPASTVQESSFPWIYLVFGVVSVFAIGFIAWRRYYG